jgi:hypothetical protein
MGEKRGRPRSYSFPIECESCGTEIKDRKQLYYHLNKTKYCFISKNADMSGIEKKQKAGAMGFPITQFVPRGGISSNLSTLLDKIEVEIEKLKKVAIKKRENVDRYIKDNISYFFDDFSPMELNELKNILNSKKMLFLKEQETSKERIDAILASCEMVVGFDAWNAVLGIPPNYDLSLERLLNNHLRQRTLVELENSLPLIEAYYVSIRQNIVFREAEPLMSSFGKIEAYLEAHINNAVQETSTLLHPHGQMVSQQIDLNPDDITEADD